MLFETFFMTYNFTEMYIRDVQGGHCDPKANCAIDKETVATALVNGNNGFGAVVGKYSMDLAITKARDVGVGVVVAHCKFLILPTIFSHHFRILYKIRSFKNM